MEKKFSYLVMHNATEYYLADCDMEMELTDEQYARILASQQSEEFEYMNDDPALDDIVEALDRHERDRGYYDPETGEDFLDDSVELIFKYPKEIEEKVG